MTSDLAISISVPGLAAFQRNATFEHLVGNDAREATEKLLIIIEGRARVYAKPHGGDRGELARSIKHELGAGAVPLHSKVYTQKLYAASAEYGRLPGRPPPSLVIGDWLRRHGGDPKLGFVVARRIGQRGTRGIFFFKRAGEEGKKAAPAVFDELARKVESRWGKA